ncbi:hypothetical protein yaldo0001_18280 [Yersinia aldovae ATCC 35236]|nr:hypothetical protein yaldo0001_18280 [Yersinia aldovae ATCC 35236]
MLLMVIAEPLRQMTCSLIPPLPQSSIYKQINVARELLSAIFRPP